MLQNISKSGFTIIELMITITIIILMTVLSIPAFSKYEKTSERSQKMMESLSLIDEIGLKVKNPEAGAIKYEVYVKEAEKEMRVIKNGDKDHPIKTVTFPKDWPIFQSGKKLVCPVGDNNCCLATENDVTGVDEVVNSCTGRYSPNFQQFLYAGSDGYTSWFVIDVKTEPFVTRYRK